MRLSRAFTKSSLTEQQRQPLVSSTHSSTFFLPPTAMLDSRDGAALGACETCCILRHRKSSHEAWQKQCIHGSSQARKKHGACTVAPGSRARGIAQRVMGQHDINALRSLCGCWHTLIRAEIFASGLEECIGSTTHIRCRDVQCLRSRVPVLLSNNAATATYSVDLMNRLSEQTWSIRNMTSDVFRRIILRIA